MAQQPKWKRVLISGSNLEVKGLTASADLEPYRLLNVARTLMFSTSGSGTDGLIGHFQTTASIFNRHTLGTNPQLHLPSSSVNSPTNPISASVVANPIAIPTADDPLVSFPVLFKDATHGGFEYDTDFIFNPVLKFEGFQSGGLNTTFRTGSVLEGYTTGAVGPIPSPSGPDGGETKPNVPYTFTGSYTSQSEVTYLDTSNGDYIKWNRGMPAGTGITASFDIPFFYNGAFQTQDIKATLRRWEPGGYAAGGAGEYIDSDEIIIGIQVFQGMNGWDDNTPLPVSASFSGSFKVNSTANNAIKVGERWQLRIRSHENFSLGYSSDPNPTYIGGYLFNISGSTATVGDEFSGDLSGSFTGNVYGGYSGSLVGVTLNDIGDSRGLYRGNGILFRSQSGGNNNPFIGQNETTMSVRLFSQNTSGVTALGNRSGIEVPDLGDSYFDGEVTTGTVSAIQLATGLAQKGLEFSGVNREQLSIDTNTNSGLTFTNGELHINDSFLGNGLTGSFGDDSTNLAGSGSINLNPSGGLEFGVGVDEGKLILTASLAGVGLSFPQSVGSRDPLSINTHEVLLTTGSFTSAVASVQQSLAVSNVGLPNQTSRTVGYDEGVDSTLIMDIVSDRSIPKTIRFKDDVLVKGNLRILDSNNVSSIQADKFETTDQFLTLNSGSQTGVPFSRDIGGFIVQTSSYDTGEASGSALFYMDGASLTVGGQTFTKAGWGVTNGKVPWDAQTPLPPFTGLPLIGQITASDYVASFSNVRLSGGPDGGSGNPENINDQYTFYDNNNLDSIGSWFIDTASSPDGRDSNVYIFGLFD